MHPSATDADVSSGPSTCSLTLPPKSRSSSFSTSFIAADCQHPAVNINAADTMHSIANTTTVVNNNNNSNYNKKNNDNMREEFEVSSKERHSENTHHKRHKRYQNNEGNNYKTTLPKNRSLSCDMYKVFDNSSSYPSSLTSLVLPDMVDANQFVVHPTKCKKSYKSNSVNNMHRPHDKYASDNNTRAERLQENQSANQGKLYKEYDIKKYNVHQAKRKSLSESEHTTHISYYQTFLGRSLPNITSSHSSAKLFRHCSPLPRKPSKEANIVTEQESVLPNQILAATHNAKHHSNFNKTINNLFIHNDNYDGEQNNNNNNNNNMTVEKRRNDNNTRNYERNNKDSTKIYTNDREMSKSVNFNSDKISSNNFNTYKLSSKYDNMPQQSFDGNNEHHQLNNACRSNKRKQKHSSHDNSQSSLLIAPWQTKSKEQSSSSLTSVLAMSTSASTLMTTDPTLHTPQSARKTQNTNSSRNCSFVRSITFDDDNMTPKLITHHFEKDLWDWMEHLYSPVESINLHATRGTVKVEERLSARYSSNKSLTSTLPQEIMQEGALGSQKHNKAEAERAVVVVKAVTVPIQLLHKLRSKQQQQHHHHHLHEEENNDVNDDDSKKEWEEELIKPWLSEQLRRANKMLKKYAIDNVITNTDVVKLQALLITDKNMTQSTFKNHVKHELETANGKITRTVFLYARPYVANVCSLAEYVRTYWLVNPFTEAKDALPLNREPNIESNEFVSSIASLLWQMVCALCKLHEMKLIHGNLKPNNVLVQKHNDTFYVYLTDYLLPLFPENYLEYLPLTLCKEIDEVNNGSIFSARERPYKRQMTTKQKHNYARLVQTLQGSSTDLCFTYGSATPTKRANAKKHTLREDAVQVDNNKYKKNNKELSSHVIAKYKEKEYHEQEQWEEEEEEEEEKIYISDNEETEQDPKQEINMLLHLTAPECVLVTCPAHSELEASLSSTTKKLHSTKQNTPQTKDHLPCVEYDDDDDDDVNNDNVQDENDKSFNACADVGEMLVKEANTPRRWKNNKHVSVSDCQYTEDMHVHSVKLTFDNCNNGSGGKGCKKMHRSNKTEVNNEEQEQIWINETKRTEASDAYALGVLLHVMVIGYYPPLPPFRRAIRAHSTDNASFSSSVFAPTESYSNMADECGTPHSKKKVSTTPTSATKNKARMESAPVYELQEPVYLEGITFQGYLWSVRNEEYINRKYGKGGERLAVPRSYQQSLSLPSDKHKIYSLLITTIEGLLEPDVSDRMTLHRVKDLLETYFDRSITINKQNKLSK